MADSAYFTAVKTTILGELQEEGASATNAQILALVNEAVDQISEILRPAYRTFPVSTWGTVTTEGIVSEFQLPTDLIGPMLSVMYDDEPISPVDAAMFEEYAQSLGAVDDPVWNVLGTTFRTTAPDVTLLKIRAKQALPHYVATYTGTDVNPMGYLPSTFAGMPAYYALAHFGNQPNSEMQAQRQQRNLALWTQKLEYLRPSLDALAGEPYSW